MVQNGRGLGPEAEAAAQQVIQAGAFNLTIHLNHGDFADYYETCDLHRGLHPDQCQLSQLSGMTIRREIN